VKQNRGNYNKTTLRRDTCFNSCCRRRRWTASRRMTVLWLTAATASDQTLWTTGLAVTVRRVAEVAVTRNGLVLRHAAALVLLRRRPWCTVTVRRDSGTRRAALRRCWQYAVVVRIGRSWWSSFLRAGCALESTQQTRWWKTTTNFHLCLLSSLFFQGSLHFRPGLPKTSKGDPGIPKAGYFRGQTPFLSPNVKALKGWLVTDISRLLHNWLMGFSDLQTMWRVAGHSKTSTSFML